MGETPEQAVVRELQKKSGLPHNIFRYLKNWNMNSGQAYNSVVLAGRKLGRGAVGKEGQPGEWMSLVGLNADDFRQPMNR